MLIKNVNLLFGNELEFIENAKVSIDDGIFKEISNNSINFDGEVFDAEGLLMIPGLINAHTHIGDSIAKDVASNDGLDKRVHPVSGIKREVLAKSEREHLIHYMKASCLSMLKRGITAFADFREGEIEGINLIKEAVNEIGIRCMSLGRVEYYFTPEAVQRNEELSADTMRIAELIIRACDGFGISGASEYSDKALAYFRRTARENDRLLAIHAAETVDAYSYSIKNFGKSEIDRLVEHYVPDFIVHMTNASEADLRKISQKNIGIVVCPRANGVLGVGIPKVISMINHGCKVAIGTDNVMINSPDLFRELDYLWKVNRAMENHFLSARELLKMVSVNAANILKLSNLGFIEKNMLADAVFIDMHSIDLEPMHDPYAGIVHRVDESSIKAVMIEGKFVHGSI